MGRLFAALGGSHATGVTVCVDTQVLQPNATACALCDNPEALEQIDPEGPLGDESAKDRPASRP